MTDHQRIHPVMVPPTYPPPQGPFPSVKVDPSGRNAPVVKRTNCWCKCLCWIITTFILLLIIVAAALAILYLVFQPKLPKYSVDNLRITDLTLHFDLTLYARFAVPGINSQILPGSPEYNIARSGANRPKSIRNNSASGIARAATDWKDSFGS